MNKRTNEQDSQAEIEEFNAADYKAMNELQKKVVRAFATLRLLSDKDKPLSVTGAIERAHALEDSFRRWEESGALIKDIAVRLSDGKEIAMDQSQTSLSLCGVHFRNSFPPSTVLHVYKKADEQFEEVQLLALELRGISNRGYRYKSTYKNRQTLAFTAERCKDGQFYIMVECTDPKPEKARGASGALNLIGPSVLTAGLLALKTKCGGFFRQLRPNPIMAYGVAILSVGALVVTSIHSRNRDDPTVVTTSAVNTHKTLSVPANNSLGHVAIMETVVSKARVTANRRNYRHVTPLQYEVEVNTSTEPEAQMPIDSGDEIEGTLTRREIYVTTGLDGNMDANEVLRKAFVRALESTEHFLVLTDTQVNRQGYRVDLHFARKNGSNGVLFAEFYDEKGGLAWFGNTDCHQIPQGRLFEEASQALVADFVSSLNSSKRNLTGAGLD